MGFRFGKFAWTTLAPDIVGCFTKTKRSPELAPATFVYPAGNRRLQIPCDSDVLVEAVEAEVLDRDLEVT